MLGLLTGFLIRKLFLVAIVGIFGTSVGFTGFEVEGFQSVGFKDCGV